MIVYHSNKKNGNIGNKIILRFTLTYWYINILPILPILPLFFKIYIINLIFFRFFFNLILYFKAALFFGNGNKNGNKTKHLSHNYENKHTRYIQ